jgi:hypothetical protein
LLLASIFSIDIALIDADADADADANVNADPNANATVKNTLINLLFHQS